MRSGERRRFPLVEILHTFQGEGIHSGKSCLLVRLWGCDMGCSWCDTRESWDPAFRSPVIPRLTAEEIAELLLPHRAKSNFVLLTGGEPTLHPLEELVDTVHQVLDLPVHIESAGHHPIPLQVDWITLSPKTFPGAFPALEENIRRADEIKLIITHPRDIQVGLELTVHRKPGAAVWLHPEWSHRKDPHVLEAITRAVLEHPHLRAGYQIHKLFGADQEEVILRGLNRPEATCTILSGTSPQKE